MSKKTEQELIDLAGWWHYWKDTNMPIDKKLEFLTKAMDIMLWVVAGNTGDIQKLERRGRSGFPRDLVLPASGIRTATGHTYTP